MEFMGDFYRGLSTVAGRHARVVLKDNMRDLRIIYTTPYDKELRYLVGKMSHVYVYQRHDGTIVVKSLSDDSETIKNNMARYEASKYIRALYYPLNMIAAAGLHGLKFGIMSMYGYFVVKLIYISTATFVVTLRCSSQ